MVIFSSSASLFMRGAHWGLRGKLKDVATLARAWIRWISIFHRLATVATGNRQIPMHTHSCGGPED